MHRDSISKSPRIKKHAHKSIFILLLSFVIAFATVYALPKEQVKANPFAIPAGIQLGAGVYVIGGLLVAGGAGLIGYEEHGEEIKQHSLRAWENATQLSKDSLNLSIEAAQGIGNGIVNLQSDFQKFIDAKLENIGQNSVLMSTTGLTSEGISIDNRYHNSGQLIALYPPDGGFLIVNGMKTKSISLTNGRYKSRVSFLNDTTGSWVNIDFPESLENNAAIQDAMVNAGTNFAAITGIYSMAGVSVALGSEELYANIQQGISRTREVWESMRDAGLVLPVDSVTSHVGDNRVKYDAQSDVYRDDAGTTYAPGDVTHAFPQPRWREKTNDIPDAGVWVDTPAVTGNPAVDRTVELDTSIPKTTTNVTTGTTVANPDIAVTEPGIPGGGTNPPTNPPIKLPGTQPIVPIALMLGLFDLLRAILMYLVRMFTFVMTLPMVAAIPIENPYFQWFRTATILGVKPYSLVMTAATFFMSFAAYKSIRRLIP